MKTLTEEYRVKSKGSGLYKVLVVLLVILVVAVFFWYFGYRAGVTDRAMIFNQNQSSQTQPQQTVYSGSFQYEVYFSPNGGAEDRLISLVDGANSSVHMLIFSFTTDELGDAVIDAHNRGLDVKVLFEKGQVSEYSEYEVLLDNGVEVKQDTNPSYMHDKIAIIDGQIVVTGSFNWSSNAETRNNENMLVIWDTGLAQQYEVHFQDVWSDGR